MLFPAHAGVIPAADTALTGMWTFPRPRGGDPNLTLCLRRGNIFSPPVRG